MSAVACTVKSIAPPADDGDNHHVQQQGGSSNDNGHDDSVQLYTRMFPTFTWTIPDAIDPWRPSIPQEPDVQFCDLETNWHFSFEAFRALASSLFKYYIYTLIPHTQGLHEAGVLRFL